MDIAEADLFAEIQETTSLQLPYDRLKTPNLPYRVSRHSFVLKPNPVDSLTELGLPSSNGGWAVLLAVCGALFYRYSGQVEIPLKLSAAIGSGLKFNGRSFSLVLNGQMRFRDLVAAVDTQLASAGAAPEDVTADTGAALAISLTDSFENELIDELDWRTLANRASVEADACHDLHIVFARAGSRLAVVFVYNALLFEAATIERLAAHQRVLMLSAAGNPDSPLAGLQLFSEEESHWLSSNGRGRARTFAPEPVFRDIERQAREQPERTAVRFRDDSLSYRTLNRRANRLAHFLRSRGVAAESRIIVCVEPSLDIAVALLAILKAGATYVPLNPAYPRHRIETILEDTDPALVLTHTALTQKLEFGGRALVLLDNDQVITAADFDRDPDIAIDLNQTAYIYYTSGTTGKPKGVMASHANLINYIRVAQEKYGFNRDDVMPAMAAFTFSISLFELLSPLVAGGTLLLLERGHILDAEKMAETLKQITFIHAGPSLLKNLVNYLSERALDGRQFPRLRHLSSGGDMIPPELLRKLQQLFPEAELYVIYGCSEVSCMGCTWFMYAARPVLKTYVGKPFDNVRLALLDDDGNRVPVGAVGDVCIGGAGVVKGYLNRPELTAEKFFSLDGERFYRTGDRGRLNREGNLELLGRRDFQVQLRGMRIELGEIEYHLRQAPGVRDGVVMAAAGGPSGEGLIAYFVADGTGAADSGRLREHLQRHLPDYMVPGFYWALDALPLNHNLKVDRKALPGLEALRKLQRLPGAQQNVPARAPATDSERELAAIWCELLKLDTVDLNDNFLVLGGDSLLAMDLIAAVKKRMAVTLDGMDILRESLQVLAAICDRQLARPADPGTDAPLVTVEVNPCEALFFGREKDLYGLLHFPSKTTPSKTTPSKTTPSKTTSPQSAVRQNTRPPVLICAPPGQEYARCYFFLKTLADSLAREGFTVLRFDYFGTGDSFGESESASLERWRADLVEAQRLLLERSQAERISVLGIRLGALLALTGLDSAAVARWVLWDPVIDGALHYRELARMHREKIRQLHVIRNWKRPRPINGAEELMGTTYSKAALEALRSCSAVPADENSPLYRADILSSERDCPQLELLDAASAAERIHRLDLHCGWYESFSFNKTVIDKTIAHQLLTMLTACGHE